MRKDRGTERGSAVVARRLHKEFVHTFLPAEYTIGTAVQGHSARHRESSQTAFLVEVLCDRVQGTLIVKLQSPGQTRLQVRESKWSDRSGLRLRHLPVGQISSITSDVGQSEFRF